MEGAARVVAPTDRSGHVRTKAAAQALECQILNGRCQPLDFLVGATRQDREDRPRLDLNKVADAVLLAKGG